MGYLTFFLNEIYDLFIVLPWIGCLTSDDVHIISIHTLKELLELATIQFIGHYGTHNFDEDLMTSLIIKSENVHLCLVAKIICVFTCTHIAHNCQEAQAHATSNTPRFETHWVVWWMWQAELALHWVLPSPPQNFIVTYTVCTWAMCNWFTRKYC